jgi:hypothetical protein
MSLPLQKLEMPKIPGFHTHWMRAEESRVRQAMRAGYTYVDQAAFWSSLAPIATQDITPSADYDTLTDEALVLLGPDWSIVIVQG